MKIIVTGGRDYKDINKVYTVLNALSPDSIVVGDCPTGVDEFVRRWQLTVKEDRLASMDNCWPKIEVYEADWDEYGKAAGPIRNGEMLEDNTDADFVVVFPGGNGTKDCARQAKLKNFIILRVE